MNVCIVAPLEISACPFWFAIRRKSSRWRKIQVGKRKREIWRPLSASWSVVEVNHYFSITSSTESQMAEWNPHGDRARAQSSTPYRTTRPQTRTHPHTVLQISAPPQCVCSAWSRAERLSEHEAYLPQWWLCFHNSNMFREISCVLTDWHHSDCWYTEGSEGPRSSCLEVNTLTLIFVRFPEFLSRVITNAYFFFLVSP